MTEPLDPPDEIDDSPRDEEIAALKEDVKALRGLLRRCVAEMCHLRLLQVFGQVKSDNAERLAILIAEIEKELEN